MKATLLFLLFILVGCNGAAPELSPLSDIQIAPPPPETNIYSLSVYASNLAGSTITLTNGLDTVEASADGTYVFPKKLAFNDSYNVTVSSATMNCAVKNGVGTARSNVGNTEVKCAPTSSSYIQGAVQGFSTGSIMLSLKIGGVQVEQKALTPDQASYAFSNYVTNGSQYDVSIVTKPSTIDCTIEKSNGTITQNLNDVNLICNPSSSQIYSVSGTITGLAAGKKLTVYDSANTGTNEVVYTGTGSPQNFTVTNFIQGHRYILELAKSDSDTHCFFSDGTYKKAARAMANVSGIAITCLPRNVGGCGAFTGELPANIYSISKIVCENDKVYMAGYKEFGKYMGGGWTSLISDNAPNPRKTFDRVRGSVSTAIPDGSGGWYIGGDFNYVGDVNTSGVAHLFSDLTVDESFKVNIPGTVLSLVRKGFMLYIGGNFPSVSVPGSSTLVTKGLAALDLSTSPYTITNLSLNLSSSSVYEIKMTDSNLILRGVFKSLPNSPATYLEKYPITSSSITTTSNPYSVPGQITKLRTLKKADGNWMILYSDTPQLLKVDENSSISELISTSTYENWDILRNKIYVVKSSGLFIYDPETLTSTTFSPSVTTSHSTAKLTVNSDSFCISNASFVIGGVADLRKGLACFNSYSGSLIGNSSNLFRSTPVFMSENQLYSPSTISNLSSSNLSTFLKFDLSTHSSDSVFSSPQITSVIYDFLLDGSDIYLSASGQLTRIDKLTGASDSFFSGDTAIMNGKSFSKLTIHDNKLYMLFNYKLYTKSLADGTFVEDSGSIAGQSLYDFVITENILWRFFHESTYKISTQLITDYGLTSRIAVMNSSSIGNPTPLSLDRIESLNKIYDPSLTVEHTISGTIIGRNLEDDIYRFQSSGYFIDNFQTTNPITTPLQNPTFAINSGFRTGKIYDDSVWQFSNSGSPNNGWYNTTDTHPYVKVIKIK